MSEQAQGPGWWQASDGKWYPPESHPDYQAPAQPPAAPMAPPVPPAEPTAQMPAAPMAPPVPPVEPTTQMPAAPMAPPAPPQPMGAPPMGPPPMGPPPAGMPPMAPGAAPYGAPPAMAPGAAPKKSKKGLIIALVSVVLVAAIVGIVLVVINNNNNDDETVARDPKEQVDDKGDSDVEIRGDSSPKINGLVKETLASVEKFWTKEYPKVYSGEKYEPVKGGFYSVTRDAETPPCAEHSSDVQGNAYYCSTKDVVAWDAEELLPTLQENFGDLSIGVVFAHEWGHAIQARSKFEGKTVTMELQADCFAGAYVAEQKESDEGIFEINDQTLDAALAGILQLRDSPGTSAEDPTAHGSAFDRAASFQSGFKEGAATCAKYADGSPPVIELPFSSQEDADRGGNLPFQEAIDIGVKDLENFWSLAYPKLSASGETWKPLAGVVSFESQPPKCGEDDTAGYALFYCVADDTIYFSRETMSQIAEEMGDFAAMGLIGTQYGLAVLTRLGEVGSDNKAQNLRADCLTGAWTASVFMEDRKDLGGTVRLSPGDLDEAVTAMLVFGSAASEENSTQGTGFERLEKYRSGVMDGFSGCK